ncbi:hypothetical protein [Rhodoligotrophos defluvii]|uniref:hypothetical protein n=1 Tax=Rhodoligotrophos defluvii TaxID=2561934 RepID=UPI0010C9C837|nr:hypothetical protein [Rhodoligotrophos defluvii]
MSIVVSLQEAEGRRQLRTLINGTRVWLSMYIGKPPSSESAAEGEGDDAPHPVAYLVEQEPNSVIRPHFHQADQFQLFLRGGGLFGRTPLKEATLHFADAFTPYGPITSGAETLEYLTLRNGLDPGAKWMPEARSELKALGNGKRRGRVSNHHAPQEAPEGGRAILLPEEPDGLAAWMCDVECGERMAGPDPKAGGGQYWIVLSGDVLIGGHAAGPMSCTFVSEREPPLELVGGEGGARVIFMQFPMRQVARAPEH